LIQISIQIRLHTIFILAGRLLNAYPLSFPCQQVLANNTMETEMVRVLILLVLSAAIGVGLISSPACAAPGKDIVETAQGAGSFNTLVAAVQAAGLVDVLKGSGPFTVFAPTDAAFAKLPAGTVEELLKPENKWKLIAILTYHVVPGKVMAADVVKLENAPTVFGQDLPIAVREGAVYAGMAKVVQTDITASNGVIHVIDSVLIPANLVQVAQSAGTFSTLLAAAQAAGLVDTLSNGGPFTIFAPTDEAFAKLPKGTVAELLKPENKDQLVALLTYHVVSGKVMAADVIKVDSAKTLNGALLPVSISGTAVRVGNANVMVTDIIALNGVIHVIDAVLLPPAGKEVAMAKSSSAQAQPEVKAASCSSSCSR
jgi:transforming growth factor-beta-induced protein